MLKYKNYNSIISNLNQKSKVKIGFFFKKKKLIYEQKKCRYFRENGPREY